RGAPVEARPAAAPLRRAGGDDRQVGRRLDRGGGQGRRGGSAAGASGPRWRARGKPREQLGAVYGALATGCSYPYPVIDGMTLAEAGEIFRYWEQDPP